MKKFKSRYCPECGEEIKFSYVTPEKSFEIDSFGDIMRDDAWVGPTWDAPHIEFYCGNDRDHNIDNNRSEDDKFQEWQEEIIDEFYKRKLHA